MTEHMNIDQYRKETGILAVRLGERMGAHDYIRKSIQGEISSRVGYGQARLSKYNAKRTEYNGRIYDSKAEASMAQTLDTARHSNDPDQKVTYIEYQRSYRLEVNGELICRYVADFYVEYASGRSEVIDCKGVLTPIYKLKKKLMRAIHGIEIKENL